MKQEGLSSNFDDTKELIRWIGRNPSMWQDVCGQTHTSAAYLDQMLLIKELQKNGFYSQILSMVCSPNNGLQDIAVEVVIEKMLATWDKKQWDEIIDRLVEALAQAHQEAKKQRAERNAAEG